MEKHELDCFSDLGLVGLALEELAKRRGEREYHGKPIEKVVNAIKERGMKSKEDLAVVENPSILKVDIHDDGTVTPAEDS